MFEYSFQCQKLQLSIDFCRVGLEFPSVEVRYNDLHVEAVCEVVEGKPLPTLWNSFKSSLPVSICSASVLLLVRHSTSVLRLHL